MDKPIRKTKHNNGRNESGEKSSRNDDSMKEVSGSKEEPSDEDEVVNYPNQPPIQNGFVVFIHQLNLATTAKEKRTVVEWISDALKMLDIIPEIITVDKLMEQSIATCTKPKVPIIKFSRPTAEVENATMKDGGNSSKGNKGNDTKNLSNQSKKNKLIKNDKSKTAAAATPNQNSLNPAWKGGKVNPQKNMNTSSSKSLQRKSGRPVKIQQIEDKKQEFGVQLCVLRDKVRTLQSENYNCIWVLLVESRRRCIVDMGKLNTLASKFRFKVRWIAAQAPRSLDQSVFSVVNDIVQTKNICFPEQMKGTRRKDAKDSVPDGKHKHGKKYASKTIDVEILHKTMSSQFDVSSYASFEIDQIMKISDTPSDTNQPSSENPTKTTVLSKEHDESEEEKTTKKASKSSEHGTSPNANTKAKAHRKTDASNDTLTTKSSDSSSLFEIRSTNKNYAALYNTAVQMALITTNNPFASPYTRTDLPDFHGLPTSSDLKEKEFELTKSLDANGNEIMSIPSAARAVVVVVRDMTKSNSGLATLLKNMLRREGIRSYTISVADLLRQPKALELMDSFAMNGGYNPDRDVTIGCKILIQKGLDFKLAEHRHNVIIVDVSDESFVRMWSVYNYGVKLGHKCLILEKKPDGTFENNLKRVFQMIRRRFRRRQLCTWPSNRHSVTNASAHELDCATENMGNPRKKAASTKDALLSTKSVRFAVNVSKQKISGALMGRTSTNCIYQHGSIQDNGKLTRTIKSSSCLETHCDSTCPMRTHSELPDILGGTAVINSMEKAPDTENNFSIPCIPEFDTTVVLPEPEAISESEGSMFSDDDTEDGEGPSYTFDVSGTTVKTTHSFTDNSSVDSNFLAALKESSLLEPQRDSTVLPELSDNYPPACPDSDNDTDISLSKSRQALPSAPLRSRNSRPSVPYQDTDDTTTWEEDNNNKIEARESHPNKITNSSRTSLGKNRQSLLEIHRCKNKTRTGATTSSASDENLFKGWMALPGKESQRVEKEKEKGFFLRLTGLLHCICRCGKKMKRKNQSFN